MDISFNILDYLQDNIDITRNYIYVLELVENKYYVGRTGNILKRIEQHFTGCGSIYTMTYKPIKVIEILEEFTKQDERNKTLEFMEKYGWENVRGAGWCSLKISKPKLKFKNIILSKSETLILNENDLEIKRLYCIENNSVIEIGRIIKKSPTWVANRLEQIKVIERKQLARGYNEYITSEEFKLKVKKYNDNRRRNNINPKKKVNIETNVDLKNIKQIIRDKIINSK